MGLRVEAEDANFETLGDSEGFASLDAKLAAALAKISHGELGRRITHTMEVQAKAGRMVNGRQILHQIYQNYRVNEEAGALYDFTDLMAIRLKGDNQLENFLISWDSVIAGMKHVPAPDVVELLFSNN